jgi:hypothetical protein
VYQVASIYTTPPHEHDGPYASFLHQISFFPTGFYDCRASCSLRYDRQGVWEGAGSQRCFSLLQFPRQNPPVFQVAVGWRRGGLLEIAIYFNYMYFSPYRAVNTVLVLKTSQLMLYREIIAVCSEIHRKHINTLCGQNVYLKIQSVPRSKHSPSRL